MDLEQHRLPNYAPAAFRLHLQALGATEIASVVTGRGDQSISVAIATDRGLFLAELGAHPELEGDLSVQGELIPWHDTVGARVATLSYWREEDGPRLTFTLGSPELSVTRGLQPSDPYKALQDFARACMDAQAQGRAAGP